MTGVQTCALPIYNISLQQALRLVLDEELDFRVQDDGSVIVSSNERLWRELPRRLYDVSEVLAAIERATYVPAAPSPFTIYDVLPPPGLDLQAALRGMIITIVRGREPWDHLGGRATVDFHLRGRIMSVTADDDMQQQVVNLCRVLLAVEKQHGRSEERRVG